MTKELIGMLGLELKEVRILNALSEVSKRPSDIEKQLGNKIPRTTIVRILSKLHKRGLVAKHKFSARRGGWVKEDMQTVLEPAKNFLAKEGNVAVPYREHEIIIYRGKTQMLKLADKVLDFRKEEKIYWILPSLIWESWNVANLQRRIIWLNHFLQKKSIIIDTIVADDFLKEDLKCGGRTMLEGYLHRPAIVHALPKSYLQFGSDVMVFKDRVSIMNWKDEFAIEVRNRDLVQLFRGLIAYLHTSGKRVNLHAEAEKLLKSL